MGKKKLVNVGMYEDEGKREFQETDVTTMGSTSISKCVVCNSVVGVNSKPSNDLDLEGGNESESHYNKQRVHQLKNYLGLLCKLINLNVDDSFGHLFTSTATGGNTSVPNNGVSSNRSCCSRCLSLLVNISKMQEIITRSQNLQQIDVNTVTELLLRNPCHEHRNIHRRLRVMGLAKRLPVTDSPVEIKTEIDTDSELNADEDYFPLEHPTLDEINNDNAYDSNYSNELSSVVKKEDEGDPVSTLSEQSAPLSPSASEEDSEHNHAIKSSTEKLPQFSHKEVKLLHSLIPEYAAAVAKKTGIGDIIAKITTAVNKVGGMSRTRRQISAKIRGMRSGPRKRKPDFSAEENQVISKQLKEHYAIIFPAEKYITDVHREKREEIFNQITTLVNQVGGNDRSRGQIRKKLQDFVRRQNTKANTTLADDNSTNIDSVGDHSLSLGTENKKSCPNQINMESTPGTSTAEVKDQTDYFQRDRRRLINYSKEEVDLLSKLMRENIKALFGPKINMEIKDKILIKITTAVNALGGPTRSKTQVQNKMKLMRRLARKKKMETGEPESDDDVNKREKQPPRERVLIDGTLRLKCTHCEKHFDYPHTLEAHELTHLPRDLRPLFDCPKCDTKLLSKKAVAIHLLGVHKEAVTARPRSKVKFRVCQICDKKFAWYELNKFKRHMHSHEGENRPRPFICDVCGVGFFEKRLLQHHAEFVHSTEKRFQCEFCAQTYKHATNLRKHRVSCHKDLIKDSQPKPKNKPDTPLEWSPDFIGPRMAYQCEFCDEAFAMPSRLTKHLAVCQVIKEIKRT